jgi:mersacidin/lichenicidin family type 2 lantibiotic
MTKLDIIRAWKDGEYRRGLSASQRASLPTHPAGDIELSEAEMGQVSGGNTESLWTGGCCSYNPLCGPTASCGAFTYGCCDLPIPL